jgi:hypothetical protein
VSDFVGKRGGMSRRVPAGGHEPADSHDGFVRSFAILVYSQTESTALDIILVVFLQVNDIQIAIDNQSVAGGD